MQIRIWPTTTGTPPGKLADAELHFTEGPLEGLKLVGFSVWESRGGRGLNVTFPARAYSVGGERRTYQLLRAIDASPEPQETVRELILRAYERFASEPAPAPRREPRYEYDEEPAPHRAAAGDRRRTAFQAPRRFNTRGDR